MGLALSQMNRNVLKLAVPSILANVTVPLVGIVDLAVAGRLGDASMIGGVAIATMLFDLLYWNMGFLRIGTGGMVAQAYGARDFKTAMRVFSQGMVTALSISFIILLIQYLFVDIAFSMIKCSPEVEFLSRSYFFVRIWAAPATISIYVFKGFFMGMQNAISPMLVDVTVNLVNFGACVFFALGLKMGFPGIALGTVVAQYTGLLLSCLLTLVYYNKLFKYINIKESMKLVHFKRFFTINSNLFARSICFLFIYTGFTSLSAKYGDMLLAVGTIMMKLMLLYSYFIDGFAYAGEALSGRFIGAKDGDSLRKTVRVIFIWCFWIAAVSTIVYLAAGLPLVKIMTANAQVIDAAGPYLHWLWLMPALSCVGFTWDGIYIGATSTKPILVSMILAVAAFFAVYYLLQPFWGMQALFAGFMAHLIVRSVYLSLKAKTKVFAKAVAM